MMPMCFGVLFMMSDSPDGTARILPAVDNAFVAKTELSRHYTAEKSESTALI
jgi:hypothetical protein